MGRREDEVVKGIRRKINEKNYELLLLGVALVAAVLFFIVSLSFLLFTIGVLDSSYLLWLLEGNEVKVALTVGALAVVVAILRIVGIVPDLSSVAGHRGGGGGGCGTADERSRKLSSTRRKQKQKQKRKQA